MSIEQTDAEQVESILGCIVDEYLDQRAAGIQPDIEAFAERYPDLADLIRGSLRALDVVGDNLDSRSGVAGEFPVKVRKQLGDFAIVDELGSGGMGFVYEAEQLSMGRHVALKILPMAGSLHEKSLQRFRNEVRAASMLDHPNIVSIYSVGEDRGVHFYAMQLIRGQSLARVIEELSRMDDPMSSLTGDSISQTLSVAAPKPSRCIDDPTEDEGTNIPAHRYDISADTKIELQAHASTLKTKHGNAQYFRSVARLGIQAAEALQHAHDLGVLHRDIKPANLMLDASTNLHVTDFGLARIEAEAGVTMTGDLVGTLRYMSPEQAMGKRVVVDHRCDIYSLGMTLYELIALRPAFSANDRQELLKQIALDEPRKLRLVDASIPREVETIIHKAIQKDPEDRYATAGAFADDLRAFLHDRPILAKPSGVWGRSVKWCRRHPSVVWTSLIVLIVATASLATSSGLIWAQQQETKKALDEVKDQRDLALAAEKKAEDARLQADRVLDYLTRAFRSPDPARDGGDVKLVEVLDRVQSDVREDFAAEPLIRIRLLTAIGQTYYDLGLEDKAALVYTESLELLEQHQGTGTKDSLFVMYRLGDILVKLDRHSESLELLRRAVQISDDTLASEVETALMLRLGLGNAQLSSGAIETAVDTLETLLEDSRKALGEKHERIQEVTASLALAYRHTGRLDEVSSLLSKNLDSSLRVRGENHRTTHLAMHNLAAQLSSIGRHEEAIKLHSKAFALSKALLGEQHRDTLLYMSGLAGSLSNDYRFADAINLAEEYVRLLKETLGEEHSQTLDAMQSLGGYYSHVGDYEKAIPLCEAAAAGFSNILGATHPSTLQANQTLAIRYQLAGRISEAIAIQQSTLELAVQRYGEDAPIVASIKWDLGKSLRAGGMFEDSIEFLEQAYESRKRLHGSNHSATWIVMNDLALAYSDAGREDESLSMFEQMADSHVLTYGRDHVRSLAVLNNLGVAYLNANRYGDAEDLLRDVLESREELHSRIHPSALNTLHNLIGAHLGVEQYDRALQLSIDYVARCRDASSPSLDDALARLTQSSLKTSDFVSAEKAARECMKLRQQSSPEGYSQYGTMSQLGESLAGQNRFAEAEAMLLDAYRQLSAKEHMIPASARARVIREARARIVRMYEASGKPDKAETWKRSDRVEESMKE